LKAYLHSTIKPKIRNRGT